MKSNRFLASEVSITCAAKATKSFLESSWCIRRVVVAFTKGVMDDPGYRFLGRCILCF